MSKNLVHRYTLFLALKPISMKSLIQAVKVTIDYYYILWAHTTIFILKISSQYIYKYIHYHNIAKQNNIKYY